MRFVETPVFTKRIEAVQEGFDAGTATRAGSKRPGGIQVREQDFDDLVKSVRQAGKIRRKEMRPSRETTFKPADVKSIRSLLDKSQSEFAMMIGVSVATLRN